MVISFPFGDPLAHLIPEESVNSVGLVLRKAHPSGVCALEAQEWGPQWSWPSCTDPAFGSQAVGDGR